MNRHAIQRVSTTITMSSRTMLSFSERLHRTNRVFRAAGDVDSSTTRRSVEPLILRREE